MTTDLEESNTGCLKKIQSSWGEFLSWIRYEYSVHPSNPIAPEHSEFVVINSKIKIRCIHINPDTLSKSKILEFKNEQTKNKRNSLSEEYWFTKWNRSFRIGNCNCSFRKSLRFSLLSNSKNHPTDTINESSSQRNYLYKTQKIINIETFVERLIEDTIFEAYQEIYMVESNKNSLLGVVNLGFSLNDECNTHNTDNIEMDDLNVELRPKKIIPTNNSAFRRCVHNKSKKPLIILFHGIGTSSEIWWIVIKSLVSKGYEIVAPDMLGHGYSSAPDTSKYYSFHNLLINALAIFDNYVNFEENRKCILIGHSYGCSFATAVYHHRMGLISQIILISGGGPTPLAAPVGNEEMVHNSCFQALIQPLIFCGVHRSLFYSSRGKYFDTCDENSGVPNHVLDSVKMGQNWSEGDAAFHRRIFVPTLLVHGLQDKQVTLVQECEMERTIPRSFLELIPNAGHLPMLEAPEHLIHMILCFLDCWT